MERKTQKVVAITTGVCAVTFLVALGCRIYLNDGWQPRVMIYFPDDKRKWVQWMRRKVIALRDIERAKIAAIANEKHNEQIKKSNRDWEAYSNKSK